MCEREREETRHPGRVGIRSKVWHVTKLDHRYSPVFHLVFFSLLTSISLIHQALTHSHTSWASANSVPHLPLCLYCAGVVTFLDNAALCLFLGMRRVVTLSQRRQSSIHTPWRHTCTRVRTHRAVCLIYTRKLVSMLGCVVSQLKRLMVCAFRNKTRMVFFLSFITFFKQIQEYFNVNNRF